MSRLRDTNDRVAVTQFDGNGFPMSANGAGEVLRLTPSSGKVLYLRSARFAAPSGGCDARLEVGGGNARVARTFKDESVVIFDPPLRITDYVRWNVVNGGTAQSVFCEIAGTEEAD